MSKARTFAQYWLPPLLWMALIFSASSDSGSFQRSSRIIEPFIHWLIPGLSEAGVHTVVVVVRKGAHVAEYAVFAFLIWRLMARPSVNPMRTWRRSDAIRTLLVVLLYAASDEFHQSFVPTREACIRDVLIDTAGGFLALILIWFVGRCRKRW